MPGRKKKRTSGERLRDEEEDGVLLSSQDGEDLEPSLKRARGSRGLSAAGTISDEEDEFSLDGLDSENLSASPDAVAADLENFIVPGTDLRRGSIVAIRMHNFITYNDCEVFPGQGMNVVIGPNGTGKSTLVSAIAVAMGASLKVLERADSYAQLILHGETEGYAEVELAGGYNPAKRTGGVSQAQLREERNLVLRCKMQLAGSPQFTMNGKLTTKKRVCEEVERLNIHLDNLCQFLPQERVSKFARLSPEDLLEETEKAAGPKDMIQAHHQLKELQLEHSQLQSDVRQLRSRVQRYEDQQRPMQADVTRWRQRQEFLDRITLLKKKKPWLEFDEQRQICIGKKEDVTRAEAEIVEFQAGPVEEFNKEKDNIAPALRQVEEDLKAILRRRDQLAKKHRDKADLYDQASDNEGALAKEIEALTRRIDELTSGVKTLRARIARKSKSLEELQSQSGESAEALAAQVLTLQTDQKAVTAEINNRKRVQKGLDRQIGAKKAELQATHTQSEQMKDPMHQKVEHLKSLNGNPQIRDCLRLHDYIEKQRANFRGEVFGPLCLEIHPSSELAAGLVGHAIPLRTKLMFLTTDDTDRNHLARKIQEGNLQCTLSNVWRNPQLNDRPSGMEKLGIRCYVSDLFKAREEVKTALMFLHKVHLIGVGVPDNLGPEIPEAHGDARSEQDRISQAGLAQWYAGSQSTGINVIKSVRSRYGDRSTSVQVQSLQRRLDNQKEEVVRMAGDVQTFQKQKEEFKGRLKNLNAELKNLKEQLPPVEAEIKELTRKKEAFSAEILEINKNKSQASILQNQISSLKGELEDKSNDLEADEADLEEKREEYLAMKPKRARLAVELASCYEALHASDEDLTEAFLKKAGLQAAMHALEQMAGVFTAEESELKAKLTAAQEDYRQNMTELKELHKVAQDTLPREEQDDSFYELPDNLEDLNDEIGSLESQSNLLLQNMAVGVGQGRVEKMVKEFENRQRKLEADQGNLELGISKLERVTADMRRKKISWMESVVTMLSQISAHLRAMFEGNGWEAEAHLRAGDGTTITAETIADLRQQPEVAADEGADIAETDAAFNFSAYAIELRVSFRKGAPLQILSGTRQSGGEKSVTTMLYLISLQQLSHSPFRLVDEINQGMDPRNERMVFSLLSRAARGLVGADALQELEEDDAGSHSRGMPQYFLITPKLLANLPFSEDMTVLTVFNGNTMLDSVSWTNAYDDLISQNS